MKNKHNYLKIFQFIISSIIIFNIFLINNKALSNNFLIEKDHLVLDLKHNIYWLRCSVGQTWNNNFCEGKAIKLTMEEVKQAISKANELCEGLLIDTLPRKIKVATR